MLEILQKSPEKGFVFDDAIEIQSILLELNIAGRFSMNPPNVPTGEMSQQAVTYGEHPTHFILIVLYLGDPNPTESGYVVYCFPKKRFSYFQFMEIVKQILRPSDDRVAATKMFWSSSPDN